MSQAFTKSENVLFFALGLLAVLVAFGPAYFGTVQPSVCLVQWPNACSASLDLNSEVCARNIGLTFAWPLFTSMFFSGVFAFLFRNK